jgi:hypothetical protein
MLPALAFHVSLFIGCKWLPVWYWQSWHLLFDWILNKLPFLAPRFAGALISATLLINAEEK